MPNENDLHKSIVQALLAAAPPDCDEVLFECLYEDGTLELTVAPEAAARAIPDALTATVLELIEVLETDGRRFRSGRYLVTTKNGVTEFDASFAFHPSEPI